jgi:hypothetical protein
VSDRHLQTLEMRRHELIERSTSQRAALVMLAHPLVQKTTAVDRAFSSVRRYPMLSGIIASAVVLLGSRKIFAWVARGITLYTILKKV